MEDYKIRMRFEYGIKRIEPSMLLSPIKIEPLVYKQKLRDKIYIFKKIGIKRFIELWRLEKRLRK